MPPTPSSKPSSVEAQAAKDLAAISPAAREAAKRAREAAAAARATTMPLSALVSQQLWLSSLEKRLRRASTEGVDAADSLARVIAPMAACSVRSARSAFLHTVFNSLSGREIARIAEAVELVPFEEGEAMITEGDEADAMYIIQDGQAIVSQAFDPLVPSEEGARLRLGRRSLLNTLKPGDYFGERGLLKDQKRSASVTATSKVIALRIDKTTFRELLLGPGDWHCPRPLRWRSSYARITPGKTNEALDEATTHGEQPTADDTDAVPSTPSTLKITQMPQLVLPRGKSVARGIAERRLAMEAELRRREIEQPNVMKPEGPPTPRRAAYPLRASVDHSPGSPTITRYSWTPPSPASPRQAAPCHEIEHGIERPRTSSDPSSDGDGGAAGLTCVKPPLDYDEEPPLLLPPPPPPPRRRRRPATCHPHFVCFVILGLSGLLVLAETLAYTLSADQDASGDFSATGPAPSTPQVAEIDAFDRLLATRSGGLLLTRLIPELIGALVVPLLKPSATAGAPFAASLRAFTRPLAATLAAKYARALGVGRAIAPHTPAVPAIRVPALVVSYRPIGGGARATLAWSGGLQQLAKGALQLNQRALSWHAAANENVAGLITKALV